MERCSFMEVGPVRCSEEAVAVVEHRYGKGPYCEVHADWVINKWRPAPETQPTLILIEKRKHFLRASPHR